MSNALLHAWSKTLRRQGDARAVVQAADGTVVTFRDLEQRAERWREQHVAKVGDVSGRPVVFAVPNGIAWLEIFLGLVKAGAVAVPVDSAEPLAAQQQLAAAIGAGFHWRAGQLEAVPTTRRPALRDLLLLKLTSGSTGLPRALPFTAEQMLADARQITATMGFGARDVNYALIPFGHSYGLGNLTLPLLAHGVPVVVGSSPLPQAIASDFAHWKPTVFASVPAMWRALVASDVTLASLRLAISAGSPLPPAVAVEFLQRFGQPLHPFYGSSETGGISYDRSGKAGLVGGVGRAMRGVTLRALRGQNLEVSSAAVFTRGNRRKRGAHGAWLMPDRVTIDARGELTLLGRRGDVVKVAGRRVSLTEVTERLRRLPGVRDAWVAVNNTGEPALAAVVATDRAAIELRSELMTDTASWKIPKRMLVVAHLPLTERGKIDARALRAMIA